MKSQVLNVYLRCLDVLGVIVVDALVVIGWILIY